MFRHLAPRTGFVPCLVLAGLFPGTAPAQTFPAPSQTSCLPSSAFALPQAVTLADLIQLTLERNHLLETHPDVRSARLGVERAQLLLKRAQVEAIPNPTVGASYIRQYENRSHDLGISVSVPVPVWNRNQGNIQAAQAQVGEAVQQVRRVENDLTERLATAFGAYASARQRAERYRTAILPKTRETYQLSLKAYQGGQFEYLRVLQAQRSVAEANLEYVRSLSELWRSASEIAGLLLEENWPGSFTDAPHPAPCVQP
jgi:cobalt-zinc-cadmium efflux system outer membrane protein